MNKIVTAIRLMTLAAPLAALGLAGCAVDTTDTLDPEQIGEATQAYDESACTTTATADWTFSGTADGHTFTAPYNNAHCFNAVVVDITSLNVANASFQDAGITAQWGDALPGNQTACEAIALATDLYRWNTTTSSWNSVEGSVVNRQGWDSFLGCFPGPNRHWSTASGGQLSNGTKYRLVTTARASWTTGATRSLQVNITNGF